MIQQLYGAQCYTYVVRAVMLVDRGVVRSSVRALVHVGDVGHAGIDGRVGLVDLPAFISFCSLALHRDTHKS